MMQSSPFLHRELPEEFQHKAPARAPTTYAERIIPDHEAQRGKIEMYRYHMYERAGTLGRFLQRAGDWGRKYFPFVGYGWDGIGPRSRP